MRFTLYFRAQKTQVSSHSDEQILPVEHRQVQRRVPRGLLGIHLRPVVDQHAAQADGPMQRRQVQRAAPQAVLLT